MYYNGYTHLRYHLRDHPSVLAHYWLYAKLLHTSKDNNNFNMAMNMGDEQEQPLPLLPYLCSPPAILGLVLIGELLALVLILADYSLSFSWASLGIMSMIIQWIVLSCALALCQLRPLLNRLSIGLSGCLAFSLCALIAAIILWISPLLISVPFDMGLWARSTTIAAIFSGILLRYLYLQQQLSNQQQAELQARIQSLQSRIRPHFLFNSMNTIASLINLDPKTAERTVEDLSDLFRSSLQNPGLVSLGDEIELCRSYIAIEQIRLAERLIMEWDFDAAVPSALVPSLFLQPLLENAIGHGVQLLIKGGTIKLSIKKDMQMLYINIANPVPKIKDRRKSKGNQIALGNIKKRLHLHYGEQANLETELCDQTNQYLVTIRLPIIKTRDLKRNK
jgi:two-component system sensor histidine kinase AlgZ